MAEELQDEGDSFAAWRTAIDLVVGPFAITMSLVAMFFIYAILTTRKFTFNLYVVFILVPDFMMSVLDGIRCIYQAFNDGPIPTGMCYVRNFMVLFYYFSNLTVNAFIAKEVYTLVLNSYNRKRTKPPTTRTVLVQVGISYSYAAMIGIWWVAPVKWSPLTVTNDPYCCTIYGSEWFNATFGIVLSVVFSFPMLLYVFWCGYRVWHRKLLPLRGRTRALGLYFVRIVITFITFFAPMLFLALAKNLTPPEEHDSTRYFVLMSIFSIMIPIQNIVTLRFLMQKDDISETVRGYLSRLSVRFSDINMDHSEWLMEDKYERTTSDTERTTRTTRELTGKGLEKIAELEEIEIEKEIADA